MTTQVKNREYLRNPLKRRIHDEAPHIMFLSDIDAALLRLSSGILRIVECKYRNERLRNSQAEILPILADLVDLGVANEKIAEGSGVYVARYNDGDQTVWLREVRGNETLEMPIDEFLNEWVCCLKTEQGPEPTLEELGF